MNSRCVSYQAIIRSIDRLNKFRYQRMKLNLGRIFHDTNIMGKRRNKEKSHLRKVGYFCLGKQKDFWTNY